MLTMHYILSRVSQLKFFLNLDEIIHTQQNDICSKCLPISGQHKSYTQCHGSYIKYIYTLQQQQQQQQKHQQKK